ncbi:MAG TPA: NifB/NifX family molybdenum-iron cluster-binding protein [Myxococcales bacterium]
MSLLERETSMSGNRVVAIACEDGAGLESTVSRHFGHSPFFLVAQLSGEKVVDTKTVPSPGHGEGCSMPQFVKTLGAQAVVVGGLGPGAVAGLGNFGIEVLAGVSGKAGDALLAFARGTLVAREASCGGHGCGHHQS